ncbi:hypothetical protein [Amphibiibacter pelophylacis]|uniref:Uncharacterized protein n=1 Tax=Amphibiibacter pelophylacis TaxID=1799477 RepID=A0ACC6NZJ2_9BURK
MTTVPSWLIFNLALVAIAVIAATWLVSRKENGLVRTSTMLATIALAIFYVPISWLPSGYVSGLFFALLPKEIATPAGFFGFAIASAILSGTSAWLISHVIKRAIKWLCCQRTECAA